MAKTALGEREDLTHLPIVAIDPEDARDHDDAIWAEADDDPGNGGGWNAIVAIADVSFYVRPDSALDREARARVAWRGGRLQPWLGVSVIGWARRQTLDLQGTPTSATLSRIEPMMALGADVTW